MPSQLIPGHGGVMDRLDGFVAAAVAGRADRHCCAAASTRPAAACWYGDADDSPVPRARPDGDRSRDRRTLGHPARRDRLDRRQHHRSARAAIASAIRVEAVTRQSRTPAALAEIARATRRALCRGRRSGGLCANSRTRCPAPASRPRAGEAARGRSGAAPGRLGDRRDHRRGRPAADAWRRPIAAPSSRSPTRNPWSAPAACSCGAPPQRARPCCRSIPNTMRSSRR